MAIQTALIHHAGTKGTRAREHESTRDERREHNGKHEDF